MKQIGLIFLGLVATAVFYFPAFLLVGLVLYVIGFFFGDLPNSILPQGEGVALLLAVFVAMPVAFLLGSMVTGYFSYYDIDDKWNFLWMAPALYVILLGMCVSGVKFGLDAFIGANRDVPGPGFVYGILVPIALGLLYYLASLAGVALGYNLRERFAKWWYGD